jgi:hypothetical protein
LVAALATTSWDCRGTAASAWSRLLVNGAAGFVVAPAGRPVALAGFTVAGGKIVEMDILADRARVRELDLAFLDD